MALLPEIFVPPGVPPYRADGHSRVRGGVHANVPMGTGHARKEPYRTARPTVVTIATRMSAAQALLHDAWFETTLKVGTRAFTAALFGWGTSAVEYWSATYEKGSYKAVPLKGGYWMVTGKLRLTGEPSLTLPESTSAAVEFGLSLFATAVASGTADAEVEFSAALNTVQLGAVEFGAALLIVIPSYELREDGGYELREDGGRERRED